jgi:hypothetical protein
MFKPVWDESSVAWDTSSQLHQSSRMLTSVSDAWHQA